MDSIDNYNGNGHRIDNYDNGSNDNLNNRMTNLIVNYLPQSMSDEEYRVLFAKFGDIRSARIIRNKVTGYSYGFGFVDYFNEEDALKAIDNLNGYLFNNKKIKVSFARPSSDDIKNANLYVTNLPQHFKEKDINSIFAPYGEIIQCRLLGNRVGSAFVLYNLHSQAERAIEFLHQKTVPGTSCKLSIKFATNEQKKRLKQYAMNDSSVPGPAYDKRFGYQSSSNNKYPPPHTEISGPIRKTSHNNRYDPLSQQVSDFHHLPPNDMQFGYSNPISRNDHFMKNPDYNVHPNEINHFPMDQFQSPGGDGGEEFILFVYNIGQETDEFNLGKLFAYYGAVLRVNIIRRGSESRGFGFVTMKNYSDAINAISALNGYKFVNNKPLQVSFKKAEH